MTDGDLFGQVAVTWPEVIDWVEAVAGIQQDSPRFMGYVRAWSVVDKVARAKADGTYWLAVDAKKSPGAPYPGGNPWLAEL